MKKSMFATMMLSAALSGAFALDAKSCPTITEADWEIATGHTGAFPIKIDVFPEDTAEKLDGPRGQIMINAKFMEVDQVDDLGVAWGFGYDDSGIDLSPSFTVNGDQLEAGFGTSMLYVHNWFDLNLDLVAVGANLKDEDAHVDAGSIKFMSFDGSDLALVAEAIGTASEVKFGSSLIAMPRISVSESETILIGAIGGGTNREGEILTGRLPALGQIPVISSLFRGTNRDSEFSRELLFFIAPTIIDEEEKTKNGGKQFLAVGAPGETVGDNDYAGAVYVYEVDQGDPGLLAEPPLVFEGTQEDEFLGRGLAYLAGPAPALVLYTTDYSETGDENGNGVSGEDNVGHVLGYGVTEDAIGTTPSWELFGDEAGGGFAFAAVGLRFDSDEYWDLAVSSVFADNGNGQDVGKVDVFLGSAAGLSTTPGCTIYGTRPGGLLGADLAAADMNGDGRDDIAAVSPNATDTVLYEGMAHVFYGRDLSRRFGCLPFGKSYTVAASFEGSSSWHGTAPRALRASVLDASSDIAVLIAPALVLYVAGRLSASRSKRRRRTAGRPA